MFADSALLQPVRFRELANGLAVFPRAQAEHQLLPHCFRQRFTPMEHLVTAQPHFPVIGRAHAGPLNRHLLPHHDAVALLTAPTDWPSFPPVVGSARRPIRGLLLASTNRSTASQLHGSTRPLLSVASPSFRPSAAPSVPPDFLPRPLPRTASQLAAFQFGMVSS